MFLVPKSGRDIRLQRIVRGSPTSFIREIPTRQSESWVSWSHGRSENKACPFKFAINETCPWFAFCSLEYNFFLLRHHFPVTSSMSCILKAEQFAWHLLVSHGGFSILLLDVAESLFQLLAWLNMVYLLSWPFHTKQSTAKFRKSADDDPMLCYIYIFYILYFLVQSASIE